MTAKAAHAPLASIEMRSLAILLDLLILFIPCTIMGKLLPVIGGLIVFLLYAPILEASELQATLGKHVIGIQVVDRSGHRIALRTAMVRNVLKCVSSALLLIGFIFALFSKKKQTLHDMLADTIVVYGKSHQPIADVWLASFRSLFKSSPAGSTNELSSALWQLERLQGLRDKGTLTNAEFQEQKKKILSGKEGS